MHSMIYANILIERGDDFVAKITLNRPNSLNTFNVSLAKELIRLFKSLTEKQSEVILNGQAKHLRRHRHNHFPNKSAMEYRVDRMYGKLLVTTSHISKPVIAQVHGVAAANGAVW